MPANKAITQWLGRDILSPKHHDELELKAAVYQFAHKMSKEAAEHHAYQEYLREHAHLGAAHHLSGMKNAMAAGDQMSAQKHGMLYNLHAKNAGFDPMGPPPQEVLALIQAQKQPYKFKPHTSDQFLVNQPLTKSELVINLFKEDSFPPMEGLAAPKRGRQKPFAHKESFAPSSMFHNIARTSGYVEPKDASINDPKWATRTQMFVGGGKPIKQKPQKVIKLPGIKPNKLEGELMGQPKVDPVKDFDAGSGKDHVNSLNTMVGRTPMLPSGPPVGLRGKKKRPNVSKLVDSALKDLGEPTQSPVAKKPKIPQKP